MFKALRISVLLYVLAFVAVGTWVTQREARGWDRPLLVRIFAIPADGSPAAHAHVATLEAHHFEPLQQFFATEAQQFGIDVDPFEFDLDTTTRPAVPALPSEAGRFGVLFWSLRMRWLATTLAWRSERDTPDITIFAVYHDGERTERLDRSTALHKGMIVLANVFAHSDHAGSNTLVIGHELLHTLGATDKYAPVTNQPLYPDGFAEPEALPLYPQAQAELMAGRRAVSPTAAEMPDNLRAVVIGHRTAAEIGWSRP